MDLLQPHAVEPDLREFWADERTVAQSIAVPAQLLHYRNEHCVALPLHASIELLDQPPIVNVPGAAYYCKQLVRWRDQWLALLDLDTLLRAYAPEIGRRPLRYVLVVAYQREPLGALEYAAIGLPVLPQTVAVSDTAQCELPTDSDLWPMLALSCFLHEGLPVPILDIKRLFEAYLD
jgi:CheW-like domain